MQCLTRKHLNTDSKSARSLQQCEKRQQTVIKGDECFLKWKVAWVCCRQKIAGGWNLPAWVQLMDHLGIPTQTYKWPKFLRLVRERSCWESQLETRQIIYRLNKRKKIIVNWASRCFSFQLKKSAVGCGWGNWLLGGGGDRKNVQIPLKCSWGGFGKTEVARTSHNLPGGYLFATHRPPQRWIPTKSEILKCKYFIALWGAISLHWFQLGLKLGLVRPKNATYGRDIFLPQVLTIIHKWSILL